MAKEDRDFDPTSASPARTTSSSSTRAAAATARSTACGITSWSAASSRSNPPRRSSQQHRSGRTHEAEAQILASGMSHPTSSKSTMRDDAGGRPRDHQTLSGRSYHGVAEGSVAGDHPRRRPRRGHRPARRAGDRHRGLRRPRLRSHPPRRHPSRHQARQRFFRPPSRHAEDRHTLLDFGVAAVLGIGAANKITQRPASSAPRATPPPSSSAASHPRHRPISTRRAPALRDARRLRAAASW